MRHVVACAVVLGTSATAIAGTINVPGDYALIQDAIDASSDDDVINIASGTYNEFDLNPGGKAITIQGTLNGDGSLGSTIDAQQGGRVFMINSGENDDTVIKDLVITGGYTSGSWSAYSGGGIFCDNSNPTITNCTISGNMAYGGYGGGIGCDESNPTICGCTIDGNTADSKGGGIYCNYSSSPTISDCTIEDNTALYGGGIYNNESSPRLTSCRIAGNSNSGIWNDISCYPELLNCVFEYNSSGGSVGTAGGAVFDGSYCVSYYEGCTFVENVAIWGGAISGAHYNGQYELEGCTFINNSAENGGAVYMQGNLAMSNCIFRTNSAVEGGAVFAERQINIENCMFDDNTANGGGALFGYAQVGTLQVVLINSVFTNNEASDGGGGAVRLWSGRGEGVVATIQECIFESNSSSHWGGGLSISGAGSDLLTISDSVFSGNAAVRGGGAYNLCNRVDIRDTIFIQNNAEEYGGGMYTGGYSKWGYYSSCKFEQNSASAGAGLYSVCYDIDIYGCDFCGNVVGHIYGEWDGSANTFEDLCTPDTDDDGVPDKEDNCYLYNPDQADCNMNGIGDICDIDDVTSSDVNDNQVPDECECLADINPDGLVNVNDLLAVIAFWQTNNSDADINYDGIVNVEDLLGVIQAWGECP